MFKNVASQKWTVLAFNSSTGARVTGDAANISAKIEQDDDGVLSASNDVAPTEAEDGIYKFDLTQAETNGDKLTIYPESTTSNVIVIGCPIVIYTRPQYFPDFAIASDGDFAGNVDGTVATVTTLTGHTVQTGDSFARVGAPAGASVSADIAAAKVDTAAILVDTADMQPKLGTPAADLAADVAAVKVDTAATLVDTAVIGAAGAGLTDVGGMSTAMKAEVNAEVVDVLSTDVQSLPGQGAPTATPTLAVAIMHLFKSWRNKKDNDGSTTNLYADNGSTVDAKQTTTESAGTVTKGEWTTGP